MSDQNPMVKPFLVWLFGAPIATAERIEAVDHVAAASAVVRPYEVVDFLVLEEGRPPEEARNIVSTVQWLVSDVTTERTARFVR